MSYDLSIEPDERYSRFASLAALSEFVLAQPNTKQNGPRGFILESKDIWMGIDAETVSAEGDNIEDETTDPTTFNCIRAHIPYGHFGDNPQRDYYPLLFAISQHVGWPLYDEQSRSRDPLTVADLEQKPKPWWKRLIGL